jgi:hypothetical protein
MVNETVKKLRICCLIKIQVLTGPALDMWRPVVEWLECLAQDEGIPGLGCTRSLYLHTHRKGLEKMENIWRYNKKTARVSDPHHRIARFDLDQTQVQFCIYHIPQPTPK